jgi:methionine synthase II (cobalamin-independent)
MKEPDSIPPAFKPRCLATTIGSLPHGDVDGGVQLIFDFTPEIPGWPQFPKRAFHENMMVQFTEGLPGLVVAEDRLYFDTAADDFPERMAEFYTAYLGVTEAGDGDALAQFAISADYAAGFAALLNRLGEGNARFATLKGQITGPFTLGTNINDQDNRCAYYDDQLRDVIIKTAAMKGLWQLKQLKPFCDQVIIMIDEPSLLNFGTQMFITVGREDIIRDINEVVDVIHMAGGITGVHCEANTDWSLLMETNLDILVFDAYDHMQGITLYPRELHAFLDKGGCLGWGIVPTLDKDAAATETLGSLLTRFDDGMEQLTTKGFDRMLLMERALITPSCGMGGVLTEPLAERVLDLLKQISETLRERNGFVS